MASSISPQARAYSTTHVFGALLLLRLVNVALVQTFFQPDEYFQCLEPAWQAAFGEGSGAYITWEWQHQLRSSLHPTLFALVYKFADLLGQYVVPGLRTTLLLWAPKVTQATIAALGDFYTWELARKLYRHDSMASTTALWMTVLNPWQFYVSVRTFSNSLETTLTIAALNYWPWEVFQPPLKDKIRTFGSIIRSREGAKSLRISLILAATAVLLRPTNILIWSPVLFFTLMPRRLSQALLNPTLKETVVFLTEILFCGLLTLATSVVADRLYFGVWAFPPYKWLYFNLSQDLAVFYGENAGHYYLTQGLPLLCTTLLPFVVLSLWRSNPNPYASKGFTVLKWAVFVTLAVLSQISHKEARFIYPLLPLLHIISAKMVSSFFLYSSDHYATPGQFRNKRYLIPGLLINLVIASYLGIAHQRAVISVMDFLRTEYAAGADRPSPDVIDEGRFAVFLMPCHSTPWRSHLIYPNLSVRALTCEPPLHTAPFSYERVFYRDEADRFYDDPISFLSEELWPSKSAFGEKGERVPPYIVGFEGIEPVLTEYFAGTGSGHGVGELRRVWEGWNGLFTDDWRRAGKLVVWETGA
ncbi:hypothetical protein jhhlp_004675 [Lomentospora prolificans]|uniref:Mannosyltransferase n=1 Tax=Lomentospora prolificans TaxID=41688 RepID=A0A2N3NC83_9PEZI|nr:hypothetical protein jhhlp_004675 [Lomentospora prolificans]